MFGCFPIQNLGATYPVKFPSILKNLIFIPAIKFYHIIASLTRKKFVLP
ncbi:hypothetical protein Cst_c24090 [Thermoclostridium stercorarium subsp. stercorarium DSM 8532]|uniref:Uncharacterized protein n=1 Tax=Thermoclostridium stercorarium (strain ATCC 35414 / DSM 8532 / NCIMB 11754) TaxID=1121335 RepID=L7VRU5_THES1|nr:hypothetical protein Cst_c24090 [Thermoclostridium stercorarium subsp. stercorarium DSM 8532]